MAARKGKVIPTIDPNSVVPKYHQLKEWLREQIATWQPDHPTPSEPQLSDMFNISRGTVRKALDDLVHEGLFYRVRGRGTYIAKPKLHERFAQKTAGFYEDMTSRGLSVKTRVLDQCIVAAGSALAERLGIRANDPVIKLVRVRSVENRKILVSTTYLPRALCPGLETDDLRQGSLYGLLAEKYGVCLARGVRTIEAEPSGQAEAKLLGIKAGTPLLVLSGMMYDERGRLVEYTEAKHRADRSRIEIDVFPSAPTGSSIRQSQKMASAGSPSRTRTASNSRTRNLSTPSERGGRE